MAGLLAQRLEAGATSKKVISAYHRLLAEAGPELPLLLETETSRLAEAGPVGESITRMREGRVVRQGGYDGEYGIVRAN